jgi:hypothetical protein
MRFLFKQGHTPSTLPSMLSMARQWLAGREVEGSVPNVLLNSAASYSPQSGEVWQNCPSLRLTLSYHLGMIN